MFKFIFILFIMLYFILRIRPVQGLKKINAASLTYLIKDRPAEMKILDVRDQIDYYAGHIEGALSISLGRLPYVTKTELHVNDEIVIIANSRYQCRKAARLLQKEGYRHLSYLENGMGAYHQHQGKPQCFNKVRTCK